MDAAYARVRRHVRAISSRPQILPKSNVAAAGIAAFYFRDPDGHALELIYFPPGKGDPRWQEPGERLFLGLDHAAIGVRSTAASLTSHPTSSRCPTRSLASPARCWYATPTATCCSSSSPDGTSQSSHHDCVESPRRPFAMDTADDRAQIYDRQFLLSPEKRDQFLELWEVERYGTDSYGDAAYVSVYGLTPADWYARGIRLLARTAVECTRDVLGDAIGRDIAAIVSHAPPAPGITVMDPFAGSCNTLYWILRHLAQARGIAFELDDRVFDATSRNLSLVDQAIRIVHGDYVLGLRNHTVPRAETMIVFVAPPWGDALDPVSGLDLRRMHPPIAEIIDLFDAHYANNKILYVTQIHETIDQRSLIEVSAKFDWSAPKLYTLDEAGKNHGILLGTRRWKP
jgi:hypothetical protein